MMLEAPSQGRRTALAAIAAAALAWAACAPAADTEGGSGVGAETEGAADAAAAGPGGDAAQAATADTAAAQADTAAEAADSAAAAEPDTAAADSLPDPALDSAVADTLANPEADSAAAPAQLTIPAGTQVTVATETDVSTDVHAVDDPVVAVVVMDVVGQSGAPLIPAGAIFLGRVTASAGSGGIGEPAVLDVTFETLSTAVYERPIESRVVSAEVTLDPEAERARAARGGRGRAVAVPGRIAAGSFIVVELTEPVRVPAPIQYAYSDSAATRSSPIGT